MTPEPTRKGLNAELFVREPEIRQPRGRPSRDNKTGTSRTQKSQQGRPGTPRPLGNQRRPPPKRKHATFCGKNRGQRKGCTPHLTLWRAVLASAAGLSLLPLPSSWGSGASAGFGCSFLGPSLPLPYGSAHKENIVCITFSCFRGERNPPPPPQPPKVPKD